MTNARVCCLIMALAGVAGLGGCPSTGGDNNGDDAPRDIGVEFTLPNEGARHVAEGTQVAYDANPPASGSHWPAPAQRGFYESGLEEERWVHNLEHGYITVLFDCRGACDAGLLDSLRALVTDLPASEKYGYPKVVVAAYSGLPDGALLTLVAWDHQLHLAAFDSAAIVDFYNRHLDQGPEDAP